MIDFTDENLNSGLSSFDMDRNLRKYNIGIFNEFYILVYISLEHELVARNNQIYPYIKFRNISKEKSLEILKQSCIWKALQILKEFDHISFVSGFDENALINITNNFIKDCLYDNETIIENKTDLLNFYKTWSVYFNELSKKWNNLLLREVDIIYERRNIKIDYSISYIDILDEIWKKIKSNEHL
jgi:HD-GYP domain-containing protein (c-di-GMP phosphodiesterase class II)